jgi:hypothetical protein
MRLSAQPQLQVVLGLVADLAAWQVRWQLLALGLVPIALVLPAG